jgi:two-component system, NtrC family, nitrogen regulation response regulator GlnG
MGHRVDEASSAEQGLTLAAAARPDVLLLDVRLPGMDGLTAMDLFRRHLGGAPIIIMTAFGDLRTAVGAVDGGAFEYIVKPFNLAEIRAAIERALRLRTPAPGDLLTSQAEQGVASSESMLGNTPIMQAVFKRIALAAKSDAAILLQGESGVGKETAARAIHRHSDRANKPFVVVTVAGLSATAAEAELFGHVASDVGQPRKGLLLQADGGILFLDEVADLPLIVQAKMVSALDHREVMPLGAGAPKKTGFRIITATSRDLRTLVHAGAFRHDLSTRLSTFEIALPPLRERIDDIPLLARHFAKLLGAQPEALADETVAAMQRRSWYGNARELRNAVEHALVVARSGPVLPSHLPEPLPPLSVSAENPPSATTPPLEQAVAALANALLDASSTTGDVYERFLQEVEPPLFATALNRNGNRCAPAARALGLHRTTLKRKLDQYGIDDEALGES